MTEPYLSAQTLDDLMRHVLDTILSTGLPIHPSKGPALEVAGVLLELQDPRARLSRTETRGKAFSALGELCWYLARSDRVQFIEHYIPQYGKVTPGERVYGAYGPRLFDWKEGNQVAAVKERLAQSSESRRAVIQLFDAIDLPSGEEEIPCTSTLQFLLRAGKLNLLVNMRSNDAFLGLPHDIFSFTMLQEIMARWLDVDLGWYRHAVGSLHLYQENREQAEEFLSEGWQSTRPGTRMPVMPRGDPWPSICQVLEAEAHLRSGRKWTDPLVESLDPYWRDLVILLAVHAAARAHKPDVVRLLRSKVTFEGYHVFIDGRLNRGDEPTTTNRE